MPSEFVEVRADANGRERRQLVMELPFHAREGALADEVECLVARDAGFCIDIEEIDVVDEVLEVFDHVADEKRLSGFAHGIEVEVVGPESARHHIAPSAAAKYVDPATSYNSIVAAETR